jgi:hypothetical protein
VACASERAAEEAEEWMRASFPNFGRRGDKFEKPTWSAEANSSRAMNHIAPNPAAAADSLRSPLSLTGQSRLGERRSIQLPLDQSSTQPLPFFPVSTQIFVNVISTSVSSWVSIGFPCFRPARGPGGAIFTIVAFSSVTLPLGVLISTTGMMDPAFMADLITGDRESKLRMSVKEWLAGMSCDEVVTDPARHQRSDQTLS